MTDERQDDDAIFSREERSQPLLQRWWEEEDDEEEDELLASLLSRSRERSSSSEEEEEETLVLSPPPHRTPPPEGVCPMGPDFSHAFVQSLKTLISPFLPPPPPPSYDEEQYLDQIRVLTERLSTTRVEKQTAFHDRAVILSLVARLGQHLGLAVGLLNDPHAPEGYQMRLVLELPSGQVSWHLPDEALSFFDDIGTCTGPYAEQPTTQEWERILHPDLERAVLSPHQISTLPVGVPTGDDLRTDAKTTKRQAVKKKQAREETV